jgi:hypothetical protein
MKAAAAMALLIGCTHGMPPADPRCAGGDPLFQGDDRRDGHDIRVWISTAGAWAYSESGRSIERGCLDAAALAEVNDALSSATWMQREEHGYRMPCNEPAMRFHVHDQLVFTTECWVSPDEATATAIVEIFATVNLARGG